METREHREGEAIVSSSDAQALPGALPGRSESLPDGDRRIAPL